MLPRRRHHHRERPGGRADIGARSCFVHRAPATWVFRLVYCGQVLFSRTIRAIIILSIEECVEYHQKSASTYNVERSASGGLEDPH